MEKYLKPGDFVSLIPVGLPITLQYNISGNLEKVYVGYNYVGYETDMRDCSDVFMDRFLSMDKVPARISLKRGTTWVSGILYTDTKFKTCGLLPKCMEQNMIDLFNATPNAFKFYAFNVKCSSYSFGGASQRMQFLHINKFNVLPGWYVPPQMNQDRFDMWLNDGTFKFHKIITHYAIHTNDNLRIVSTGLSQHSVQDMNVYIDDSAYLRVALELDDDSKRYLHYGEARKYGVGKKSSIITDSHSKIISCSEQVTYPDKLACPVCGKQYNLSGDTVTCSDESCASKLLTRLPKFFSSMCMESMSTENIRKHIEDKTLTCISDVFLLPEYADKEIDVSLVQLLSALIPITDIKSDDVYVEFITACSDNVDTFKYYVSNPNAILTDLHITSKDKNKLVEWLSVPANNSDITSLLLVDEINIVTTQKKYNFAPVFRDKIIYITGRFIHGDMSEISNIFHSYGAKVTTTFDVNTDVVITGGTNEEINGKVLQTAKNLGISVIDEQAFFDMYDIDNDLATLYSFGDK